MRRIAKAAALFLPLVLLVAGVNWYADPANVLRGDYETRVAEILVSGENAANLRNMDDRAWIRAYAALRGKTGAPIGTLALGSSHSMQITRALTGDERTFCAGVTGADLRDCISIYALLCREGLVPQRVILTVDPWFLCEETLERRAMTDGYEAFCAWHAFTPFGIRRGADSGALRRAETLFSVPYFQSSLDYLKRGLHRTRDPVATAEPRARTAMRRADGSYCYEAAYRDASAEEVRRRAEDCIAVTPEFAQKFTGISEELTRQLRAFLEDMQADGVSPAVMLAPYHPLYYAHICAEPGIYREILATEPLVRSLAAELGVPVFGSYDPAACGLTGEDFYDALHCSEEAMYRFYPEALFTGGAQRDKL